MKIHLDIIYVNDYLQKELKKNLLILKYFFQNNFHLCVS